MGNFGILIAKGSQNTEKCTQLMSATAKFVLLVLLMSNGKVYLYLFIYYYYYYFENVEKKFSVGGVGVKDCRSGKHTLFAFRDHLKNCVKGEKM